MWKQNQISSRACFVYCKIFLSKGIEMSYVPLHLHTEYSLLDGAIKIKKLVSFCKDQGWPAVAVTDHGVMHGAIELYKTANEAGIKPIIGIEVYVYHGDITEKKTGQKKIYHLILIEKKNY